MDREQDPETPQVFTVQDQPVQGIVSSPEGARVTTPGSGESIDPASTSTNQRLLHTVSEGNPTLPRFQENPYADFELIPPPPPVSGHAHALSNRDGLSTGFPIAQGNNSRFDEKQQGFRNVGDRLKPTIRYAVAERKKYAQRAFWAGWAINIAIGLQVFLGALTTVLASAITDPRRAQIATSVLGGLATLVASYLARARGSGEPELSNARVRDLEHFLRDCMMLQIDHAHQYATPENGLNTRLEFLRQKFEDMLSNAEGEKKLSLIGNTPFPSRPA